MAIPSPLLSPEAALLRANALLGQFDLLIQAGLIDHTHPDFQHALTTIGGATAVYLEIMAARTGPSGTKDPEEPTTTSTP